MNLPVSVLLHASQLAAGQMLHTPPKDWTELKQPEGKKSSGEGCLFSVESVVWGHYCSKKVIFWLEMVLLSMLLQLLVYWLKR